MQLIHSVLRDPEIAFVLRLCKLQCDAGAFNAALGNNPGHILAKGTVFQFLCRNIHRNTAECITFLNQLFDPFAGFVKDDFRQSVNESVLLRNTDKFIGRNQTCLFQVQAHQRFCSIKLIHGKVQNRVTVNEHAGVIQILTVIDVSEFTQNAGIFRIGVPLSSVHCMDRIGVH